MAQLNGHNIFEVRNGPWLVGVRTANGQIATFSGAPSYANEASATLEAMRRHREKPHMNFGVMRNPRIVA